MKSDHQLRIEEFMRKAEQELKSYPGIPSKEIRLLRAKLIIEEALETCEALGVGVDVSYRRDGYEFAIQLNGPNKTKLDFIEDWTPSLVEIADGCADISVVTIGTLSACGISDEPLFKEVDRSNLDKFRGDAHKAGPEHPQPGRWIKPSDWVPPNIAKVLADQVPLGVCSPFSYLNAIRPQEKKQATAANLGGVTVTPAFVKAAEIEAESIVGVEPVRQTAEAACYESGFTEPPVDGPDSCYPPPGEPEPDIGPMIPVFARMTPGAPPMSAEEWKSVMDNLPQSVRKPHNPKPESELTPADQEELTRLRIQLAQQRAADWNPPIVVCPACGHAREVMRQYNPQAAKINLGGAPAPVISGGTVQQARRKPTFEEYKKAEAAAGRRVADSYNRMCNVCGNVPVHKASSTGRCPDCASDSHPANQRKE